MNVTEMLLRDFVTKMHQIQFRLGLDYTQLKALPRPSSWYVGEPIMPRPFGPQYLIGASEGV